MITGVLRRAGCQTSGVGGAGELEKVLAISTASSMEAVSSSEATRVRPGPHAAGVVSRRHVVPSQRSARVCRTKGVP
jgi:hypothetical protein